MSAKYRKLIDAAKAEKSTAAALVRLSQREYIESENRLADTLEARAVLQAAAQAIQQHVHARIAGVVTRCLRTVFGPDAYEFKINFEQKRGRTEADLMLTRDGLDVSPLDAAGGGVVDVAAFALRLACLIMRRPGNRRLVVADEPFKHLSRNYRPAVRMLLQELAAELEIQFVFVTHDPALMMGKVVEL